MTPSPIAFDGIPAALRAVPTWIGWRLEVRGGKVTKVPYQATRPRRWASSTNPSTWTDYESARRAVERSRDGLGLGFVFVPRWGLVGIDLDHVRQEDTGEIEPWALDVVHAIKSYTEISVSGTGVHIICGGALPPGRRRHGQIEMYDVGRFFTMTGGHLPGTPQTVEPRTAELAALHAETFPSADPHGLLDAGRGTSAILQDLLDSAGLGTENIEPPRPVTDVPDDVLLDAARTAANGAKFRRLWAGDTSDYSSHSEADLALCLMLAFWTQRDAGRMDDLFRRSGLYRAKWNRDDYRTRTIAGAVTTTIAVYEPPVVIPEAALEPGVSSTIDLDTVQIGDL